jgi:hypothetical protein
VDEIVINLDSDLIPSLRSLLFGGLMGNEAWHEASTKLWKELRILRAHPRQLGRLYYAATVHEENELLMPKGRACRFGFIERFEHDDAIPIGQIVLENASGKRLIVLNNVPLNVWTPQQAAARAADCGVCRPYSVTA